MVVITADPWADAPSVKGSIIYFSESTGLLFSIYLDVIGGQVELNLNRIMGIRFFSSFTQGVW